MATDDPEGWDMYRLIRAAIAGDKRIHVFTNLVGVGNVEVNAFQALSKLVIQKSLREGFGLVVAEALWKGTPVVAGRAGGIPLQMADGTGGLLVDSVDECARAMLALLHDPARAAALGASGRERVRRHFLIPRLVLDELSLMRRLAAGATRPSSQPRSSRSRMSPPSDIGWSTVGRRSMTRFSSIRTSGTASLAWPNWLRSTIRRRWPASKRHCTTSRTYPR